MRNIAAVATVVLGAAMLFLACCVPAYFTSLDMRVVAAAGAGTRSVADAARFALDNAQISPAEILARCCDNPDSISAAAEKSLSENPRWRAGGGNVPYFETFAASAGAEKNAAVFALLASGANRKKLFEFLSQSRNATVAKILAARDMNTVLLPPAYSAAGAPFEASLLTLGLLAQSGCLDDNFAFALSAALADPADGGEVFQKCSIGVVALSNRLDFSALGVLFKRFSTPLQVFDFAEIFCAQKNAHFADCMYAAAVLTGDVSGLCGYLRGADTRRWGGLSLALSNGEGAVELLLSEGKPIYENSGAAAAIDFFCSPVKGFIAEYAGDSLPALLSLKVMFAFFGAYTAAFGVFGLLGFAHRSSLLSLRCAIAAAAGTVLFFAAVEPDAFSVEIQNESAAEIRIAFDKIKTNMIGEKDMFSIDTDTATLAAIVLFFVIQSLVYVVCLLRINVIKRTRASASLKLKLLDNEDNLFDLGLYIGLAGTVASLILLTFGVITASLMAGYTSTLFGILFTALVKIVHLRRFKRKLLVEAANEQRP